MAVTHVGDMTDLLAGIELGGTKCVCVLATGPDDIRECVEIPTTGPEETLNALRGILELWRKNMPFNALGIASFGPLDLDAGSANFGCLVETPKRGWSGTSLLSLCADEPFSIDTDVNGAALAEGRWGAAIGLDSWAYITVGTGVGVGSIVNCKPISGLGHSEAGHARVPTRGGGLPGTCPYHGDCVEGLASGPAIEAAAGRPGYELSWDHPALDRAAAALAHLCHNLVYTSLPQRILIGGGVILGQSGLLALIRKRFVASLSGYGAAAEIGDRVDQYLILPQLGRLAGPMGAIELAARISCQSAN